MVHRTDRAQCRALWEFDFFDFLAVTAAVMVSAAVGDIKTSFNGHKIDA